MTAQRWDPAVTDMAGIEPASLADLYTANRRAVLDERDRLVELAKRLRAAATVRPQRSLPPRAVERVVDSCFHVARLVHEALADDVLGTRHHVVNDELLDAHRAQETLDHLGSGASIVHDWGEHEYDAMIDDLEEGIDLLDALGSQDRQLFLFDPSGAGRVIEVIGDPISARHVAVVVPGMGTTVQKFNASVAARARRLHEVAANYAQAESVAVFAWLGYDAPGSLDVVDAAVEELAGTGARSLGEFAVAMSRLAPGAHRSVVAHSYGSVVAGLAAHRYGLPVDDLVVLGSPGLGVSHAEELRINSGGRVWAVRARRDLVASVPRLQVGAVNLHGASPYEAAFGARVVLIDDEGHSSYLDDDHAVQVVSRIVMGEPLDEK